MNNDTLDNNSEYPGTGYLDTLPGNGRYDYDTTFKMLRLAQETKWRLDMASKNVFLFKLTDNLEASSLRYTISIYGKNILQAPYSFIGYKELGNGVHLLGINIRLFPSLTDFSDIYKETLNREDIIKFTIGSDYL